MGDSGNRESDAGGCPLLRTPKPAAAVGLSDVWKADT
jgi:hypothetical protein